MEFRPDPDQRLVLDHERGPLLVLGGPGTGKTAVLRERLAGLIEAGAHPERVALVVRSRGARAEARDRLLARLRMSLPGLHVTTVHGLAHRVLSRLYRHLDYARPPRVLSAAEQFQKVQDLLQGEDPAEWPAYRDMLGMRGFADEVRQLLARAQEALLSPEQMQARVESSGLGGWSELARFYSRYLEVLADQESVDFAGLVVQAAAAAGRGEPLFDHVVVDDYHDVTFATERLLAELGPVSLVVAGDPHAHVFSFQGTTDVPIRRFAEVLPTAGQIRLTTDHRGPNRAMEAWASPHPSESHAAAALEIRRVHVEEGVPWRDVAVVVRRQGTDLGGVLRALDDARVPRMAPEGGVALLGEPATFPLVLAFRWVAAGPEERDDLAVPLLTSEIVGLAPARARGLVRAAARNGGRPSDSLGRTDGLSDGEARAVSEARDALEEAERLGGAAASALEVFRVLWARLAYARRLVEAGDPRSLDAVMALSDAVARSADARDPSVTAFLDGLSGGREGPGWSTPIGPRRPDAVSVLTAHRTAGQEYDTVLVIGAEEGNFPSLSRPEPMFDLAALDRRISQSERNRLRLEDERRLLRVVASRARRRVVFIASEAHAEQVRASDRSRFVGELGVRWVPAPDASEEQPVGVVAAAAAWRRTLADPGRPAHDRLSALDGLLALGEDPGAWWFQRDWTGTDRPLHQGLRVSFSKLDKLENCALQFVLSEELGLESRAGFHAWVGSLVHKLIEDCERGAIPRSLEALLAAAGERWEPGRFPSRAVSEAFRRLVTDRMLPAWFREYGETPALGREVQFEFPFDDATVSGYIDRIAGCEGGGTQITDYKTGKVRNAQKADENLQLGIYFLAVDRAEELARFRPVKAVELAFLRDRDRDGYIARAAKGFTQLERGEYRARMTERLSGLLARLSDLHAGANYRPSSEANCRFCDFKTLCPLWPEGAPVFAPPEGSPSLPPDEGASSMPSSTAPAVGPS